VRRVFRAANEHHMAIVVHMHANIDHHRHMEQRRPVSFWSSYLRRLRTWSSRSPIWRGRRLRRPGN
jgi:hypothetical protein